MGGGGMHPVWDPAGGQASPRPTGFVEHVDGVSSQRQRVRHGGAGHADTHHCKASTFPSHNRQECTA